MEVDAGALVFEEAPRRKHRGHVGLVRRLVVGEPRIAVDAIHRDLGARHQLRREPAEVVRQPLDDCGHRLANMSFVVVAVRVEPLAPVVALQGAQEPERLGAESRRGGSHRYFCARNSRIMRFTSAAFSRTTQWVPSGMRRTVSVGTSWSSPSRLTGRSAVSFSPQITSVGTRMMSDGSAASAGVGASAAVVAAVA